MNRDVSTLLPDVTFVHEVRVNSTGTAIAFLATDQEIVTHLPILTHYDVINNKIVTKSRAAMKMAESIFILQSVKKFKFTIRDTFYHECRTMMVR